MAAASPSVVVLTGQNYLRASTVGVNLDGGTDISVAVTFDPFLLGSDQPGTIVSKHNPAASQFGWKLSYDSATSLVTATIYDSAAGTSFIQRVSSVPIYRRSVVVFTFSVSSSILNIYVNGAAANGATTGSVSTIAASTEKLALFADSTTTSPQNVSKGGLYYAAIWRVVLTAAEVATLLADGITPVPLLTGHSLVAHFPSSLITQLLSGRLDTWIDSVASLTLSGFAVTGSTPYTNQATGGVLLLTNKWDYSLTDSGNPGSQGLTSTYVSTPPYLIWGAGLTEPQRASNYRQHPGDITILCRARKVVGTVQAIFIRSRGIFLQYTLASKELFAIIGDDTTLTNKNFRISFGFNLFALQGVAADIVIRYNAVSQTADAFVGDTKYTGVAVASNAFENTTGLFFANGADFVLASVVPACLDDAGVAALIAGNQSVAYTMSFESYQLGFAGIPSVGYVVNTPETSTPAVVAVEYVPYIITLVYNLGLESIPFGYTPSPYPVIDAARSKFIDPLPVITSIVVDANHHITGVATAGPTDAYQTYSYWEIEQQAGVITIVIDRVVSTQFFASRTSITNYWDVPSGSFWNGLRIRYVVQAVQDAAQIWYSPWQTLSDRNFDFPVGIDASLGEYSDPLSSIQSISVNALHQVTAVVMSGPISPAGSTSTLHHWEVEMDTGAVYSSCAEAVDGAINTTRVQIVDSFKVPVGEVWNFRRVRFVVRIEDTKFRHYPTVFYSDWYRLQDPNFNNPGLPASVVTVWPGAVNPVSDNPIVPPLTLDLFDVTTYTFGSRSALFPLGSLINHSLVASVTSGDPQYFNNGASFPPGLYTVTYVAGARLNATTGRWNDFFQGNFGTLSGGLWIQSHVNFPYYVFQSPAFLPAGYATQAEAQAAAVGYKFIFYHLGGPLGVITDLSGVTYTGSISLTLTDTQGIYIPGEWQIVSAPEGSNVKVVDGAQQYPTLTGLVRGQVHMRYVVKGTDSKARWQDGYVRIWPSPNVTDLAQQLDPNAPAKPFPIDPLGSAKLIHPRSATVTTHPTSGNKA